MANSRTQVYHRFVAVRDKMIFTLARKRGIVPSSFFITGIDEVGDHPIGHGGFADVYKGIMRDDIVALKILRPIGVFWEKGAALRQVSNQHHQHAC